MASDASTTSAPGRSRSADQRPYLLPLWKRRGIDANQAYAGLLETVSLVELLFAGPYGGDCRVHFDYCDNSLALVADDKIQPVLGQAAQLLLALVSAAGRADHRCQGHIGEHLVTRKPRLQQVVQQRLGLSQKTFPGGRRRRSLRGGWNGKGGGRR